MKILFQSIHIENFLSIGNATIELNDSGYTLVNGINQNPDDSAKSNGSGKSTIFDAIVYSLTGETIRGSKDVVNIHGNDGALVELNFVVGHDEYKIIRTKDHSKYKTNLKIYINGEDKSGKGIADSKKLLAEYLPDLTSSLLGSVIVLGQGLPQRFTNNTPSGRKEVLEKLSKSDFMIEDLKNRISDRLNILKGNLRQCEDIALTLNTKISSYERQISDNELVLQNLRSSNIIQQSIELLEGDVLDCQIKVNTYNAELETLLVDEKTANDVYTARIQESNDASLQVRTKWDALISEANVKWSTKLQSLKDDYNVKTQEINNKWQEQINNKRIEYTALNTEIKGIEKQIIDIKNIKDVCPTCGQKLPDVHKPDTSTLEAELVTKQEALKKITEDGKNLQESLNSELQIATTQYNQTLFNIQTDYNNEITKLKTDYDEEMSEGKKKFDTILEAAHKAILEVDEKITNTRSNQTTFANKLKAYETQLSSLKSELANLEATRKASENLIASAKTEIENIKIEQQTNEEETDNVSQHLGIVNKMSNAITRDFRGYLLTNIIDYIDKKAKEYSLEVFGTDKIAFILDGNNIDIRYDEKDYSNLSGGEKQKIDLIVQFAIRDMLCKYLDFSSNILVLDEICDNVDSIGAERLFNMISKKLSDVQSIFIVSHHTDFQIPVDRQLTVIKGSDKISRVEITL